MQFEFRMFDTDEKCFMNDSRVIESRINDLNKKGRWKYQLWTGLKDKEGKKIFEGDIIKTKDGTISKIIYEEASFKCVFYYNEHLVNCILDNLFVKTLKPKIIGNIFENTELFNIYSKIK